MIWFASSSLIRANLSADSPCSASIRMVLPAQPRSGVRASSCMRPELEQVRLTTVVGRSRLLRESKTAK